MAYTFTLQNAIDEGAFSDISGVCPTSDDFKNFLNQSCRRLIKRGNWFGTEFLVQFCIYNGCLVLPRYVGTVLGLRFCNTGDLDILNHWYSIVGPSCADFRCTHRVIEVGTTPIYNDISGDSGKYIRYYATKNADLGKTITIFGTDANGQPLQEQVNGVWQRGITLTLADPYVQSTVLVKKITSITRDATEANCLLYEVDPTDGYVRDIGLYEPSETNPRYRKYHIQNFDSISTGCSESNGIQLRKATALVKLQFVPVVSSRDFLAIDDFDAIKFMIQAIRKEDAGDSANAEILITKAIRELNFIERDKLPGKSTVVRVNAVGNYIASPI